MINQWIECFFPIFYFQILFGRLGVSWQSRFKSPWSILFFFVVFPQNSDKTWPAKTGGPPFNTRKLMGLALELRRKSPRCGTLTRCSGMGDGWGAIEKWVWVNTYRYIFSGMNIHLPAILGFTRYQGFDPSPNREGRVQKWPFWSGNGWKMDGRYVNQQQIEGLAMV